jgi:uncharacterized membrane protein YqjE
MVLLPMQQLRIISLALSIAAIALLGLVVFVQWQSYYDFYKVLTYSTSVVLLLTSFFLNHSSTKRDSSTT